MVSGCDTWSFGSKVASNQRVLVTPGISMNLLSTKRRMLRLSRAGQVTPGFERDGCRRPRRSAEPLSR